jgi:HPr kinase/phosphorylase
MSVGETRAGGCVALEGCGLLILGRPGAGKSQLALEMIALGATLVADDVLRLRRAGDAVIASAPPAGFGLIEARGLGLLRLPAARAARVALAVDLDSPEAERLPPSRAIRLLGVRIPLVLGRGGIPAAALAAALRAGGPVDPDAPREV